MPSPSFRIDPQTGRYLRADAAPSLETAVELAPGELAEIADDGRLQGVLTRARFLAAHRDESGAEGDLIKALWALNEVDGALAIRWRSQAGYERFAATIEAAWKASGESAFLHFVSTEAKPVRWSDGIDPADERYRPAPPRCRFQEGCSA
jgi:hypothetical protein